MDDLAAWLTQIWDEEEAFARKAGGDVWTLDGGIYRDHPTREVVSYVYDEADEHIAANDPASVLARIAADRKILDVHEISAYGSCCICARTIDGMWEPATWPCPTLRLLAQPYADRPGYREEWRA